MASRLTFQYSSLAGSVFSVKPELVKPIQDLIDKIQSEIEREKKAERLICYLSVPMSSKSGGDFQTNLKMAADVAERLRREFGKRLWVLNPAAHTLPDAALGGDYMAVWADVLAGPDGSGTSFDMIYFVGPKDVWKFFYATGDDRLRVIERWLEKQAMDNDHYRDILSDAESKLGFLRYYGLRGSTIFSKGCHDEWNIASLLNSKRTVGNDIALYFDGEPVEPGDYASRLTVGEEVPLLR